MDKNLITVLNRLNPGDQIIRKCNINKNKILMTYTKYEHFIRITVVSNENETIEWDYYT